MLTQTLLAQAKLQDLERERLWLWQLTEAYTPRLSVRARGDARKEHPIVFVLGKTSG